MSRVAPVSGFPEWAPEERIVERHVIETLRETFALHGYAEIETRAIEPLERLRGDSDAAKEIYALRRVLADPDEGDSGLGLHFDLTVPFARYVEEFSGRLTFPFRRYQIQKVWRGERPQEGRFREFYQADIDIVGRSGELPPHFESEVAVVMARALASLPIPSVRMHVNSRDFVEFFYRMLNVVDVNAALRSVDKLGKIGIEGVSAELRVQGVGDSAIEAIEVFSRSDPRDEKQMAWLLGSAGFSGFLGDFEDRRKALIALVDAINDAVPGVARADLGIARGLDYYTGVVYETFIEGHEDLGSICSGGRYDSLVAGGGYPGVGMSVGVSRLVSRLLSAGLVEATRSVPSAVLVAVVDEESRAASNAVARALRERGIPCEVAPTAAKFGKQIQHADRRGIPFVWFPGDPHEVKDIRSGDQAPADPETWEPPADDIWPRVERR